MRWALLYTSSASDTAFIRMKGGTSLLLDFCKSHVLRLSKQRRSQTPSAFFYNAAPDVCAYAVELFKALSGFFLFSFSEIGNKEKLQILFGMKKCSA